MIWIYLKYYFFIICLCIWIACHEKLQVKDYHNTYHLYQNPSFIGYTHATLQKIDVPNLEKPLIFFFLNHLIMV